MEPMMLKLATKRINVRNQVSDELFHFHDAGTRLPAVRSGLLPVNPLPNIFWIRLVPDGCPHHLAVAILWRKHVPVARTNPGQNVGR